MNSRTLELAVLHIWDAPVRRASRSSLGLHGTRSTPLPSTTAGLLMSRQPCSRERVDRPCVWI